jgi:hypothetical protein
MLNSRIGHARTMRNMMVRMRMRMSLTWSLRPGMIDDSLALAGE